MSRWIIGIPVWGERCVRTFIDVALPFHRAALKDFPHDVTYIVNTDRPIEIKDAMKGLQHHVFPLPMEVEGYARFGMCHKSVMAMAEVGDRVALMCADQIISRECLFAAEKRFGQGKKAVCWLGHRTTGANLPQPGVSAAALNVWAMANRHPIIAELFYGTGQSAAPSILYFEKNGSIVMRAFGLGPFAFVMQDGLYFEGTIDTDLAARFDKRDLHIVTDCNEMSCATIDPPEAHHGTFPNVLTPMHVAAWAAFGTNDMHRWFITHKVRIQGDGECDDQPVIDEVLRLIPIYEDTLRDIMIMRGGAKSTHGHG